MLWLKHDDALYALRGRALYTSDLFIYLSKYLDVYVGITT